MKEFVIFTSVALLLTIAQVDGRSPYVRKLGRSPGASSSNPTDGCPPFGCSKNCTSGYAVDEKGCKLCACAVKRPKRPCPEIECPNWRKCPGGYRVDENGCTLCECNCPLHGCMMMSCEYGLAEDENGCTLCRCNERPVCEPFGCLTECPEGFVKDRRGCSICRCRGAAFTRSSCSRSTRSCTNECSFGRTFDRNGCPTCTCNPRSVGSVSATCSSIRTTCSIPCIHGYERDANGCEVCRCADPTVAVLPVSATARRDSVDCSRRPSCQMYCEQGFEKDTDGCDECRCRAIPKASIRTDCVPRNCKKNCAFGYQVDSIGCKTCTCKPSSNGDQRLENHRRRIRIRRSIFNFCHIARDPIDIGPCEAELARIYFRFHLRQPF